VKASNPLREKLKQVYSPEPFGKMGTHFVSALTTYLKDAQQNPTPVFPLLEKSALLEKALRSLKEAPASTDQSAVSDRFSRLCGEFLKNAQRIHSPHCMGHQVSPPVPAAALFDGLASFTNQGLAVGEMGPFAMAAERAIVQELGQLIGWGKGFDGIATGGGTLANLTAILAARNRRYGDAWEKGAPKNLRPALITSAESHYSVSRAAGVLGIGTSQVIKAPLDKKRRLDSSALPELIDEAKAKGLDVFCIVASCPSTPIGAFDEIPKIAAIAQKHGIWCHVDGAHGASVLFSEKHKHLVQGIEMADSVIWDAHKLLFVPSLSTYLLFKNDSDSWGSFQQEAPYLFDRVDDEQMRFNAGLRTFECTKRGLSVALWGVWSLYGRELFSDLVDLTFANTREFYEMLRQDPAFEALHEPECNIICFKLLGADQAALRRKLQESGDFYITTTKLDGEAVLRLTLMNPLTESHHLEGLLSTLKRLAI
jgi:L-2,4-diaminobutyrate decarboxylase